MEKPLWVGNSVSEDPGGEIEGGSKFSSTGRGDQHL